MSTKYCKRCDLVLPIDKFGTAKSRYDGLQTYCSECMKLYRIEHYNKNKQQYFDRNKKSVALRKQYILELKNLKGCTDCGIKYPGEPWLFDFDHLRDKSKDVGKMARMGYSLEVLKKEIEKCEIVCLICHRRRTAKRASWVENVHSDYL